MMDKIEPIETLRDMLHEIERANRMTRQVLEAKDSASLSLKPGALARVVLDEASSDVASSIAVAHNKISQVYEEAQYVNDRRNEAERRASYAERQLAESKQTGSPDVSLVTFLEKQPPCPGDELNSLEKWYGARMEKINSIKCIRSRTGLGLKEAKELFEKYFPNVRVY